MSYTVIEEGLLNVIRLATGFDSGNISKGDYRILTESREFYVVLTPGAIRNRQLIAAPRYISTTWLTNIELFVPYDEDLTEIWSQLRTARQSLIDTIDAYPTLNSTTGVFNAFLGGGAQPEIRRGSGRRWWYQSLEISIDERLIVSILE